MSKVWPPVFSFATIFGTVPDWCSATSSSPVETAATPLSEVSGVAWLAGNVSCVPGRKKSWTKCVPGLPSFERSVITDWFACKSSPPPLKPPGPPNPFPVWAVRVTVRSVPILESGFSAVFCAWERPFERPEMTITSATPRPNPSTVSSVRVRRRRSSRRM